jgi:hypothetical protein
VQDTDLAIFPMHEKLNYNYSLSKISGPIVKSVMSSISNPTGLQIFTELHRQKCPKADLEIFILD